MINTHQCHMPDEDFAVLCICAIGRDHDTDEFEAWEANGWEDPNDAD